VSADLGPMTETLQITSTNPASNALHVPVTSNVSATFNADVEASTITSSTFLVQSSFSGRYTGTLAYDAGGRTVTMEPAAPFKPGELVIVVATAGISLTPHAWEFWAAVAGGSAAFFPHPATGPAGRPPACS
jgi:hypothetical protein